MKITDRMLLEYLEGNLDARSRQLVETQLAQDAELADKAESIRHSMNLPIDSAYSLEGIPPAPGSLIHNLNQPRSSRLRWTALAASITAALLLGFVLGKHNILFQSDDRQRWVELIADYQSLYSRATVGSTEQTRQEAEMLLSSLKNLDIAIPDLTGAGYDFKRAQQLSYRGEPLIQLVYLKEGRLPLALCYMVNTGKVDPSVTLGEHAGMGTAYWSDKKQRYVIIADEKEQQLEQLVRLAQQNLN